MAERYRPFRYEIEATFNRNSDDDALSEPVPIPPESVRNMIIDRDYMGKFTPIFWISFNMPEPLLDDMIKHKSTGTVIIRVDKHTVDSEGGFIPIERSNYIKDEFVYFVEDTNRNTLKDTQYEEDNERDVPDEIYREITIGFLKMECVNKNRKTINTVYRNCTLTDIVLYNTRDRPLLMEPLDNTNVYDEIVIPPLDRVSSLIKYLDDNYRLYKTPHLFYMDLDRSYLQSSSGENIKAKGDEIESVFINMRNPVGLIGKIQGAYRDEEKYIFEADTEAGIYFEDSTTDAKFNNIVCIDSEGNRKEFNLDLNTTHGSIKKHRLERVSSLNLGEVLKNKIEMPKTLFRVLKNDLDASVLTPNVSYFVYNEELDDKKFDGQYTLSEKRDIFIRVGDIFEHNTLLFLRKVS